MTCFWTGCFLKHFLKTRFAYSSSLSLDCNPLSSPYLSNLFFSLSPERWQLWRDEWWDLYGGWRQFWMKDAARNASHYQYCTSLYYGVLVLLYSLLFSLPAICTHDLVFQSCPSSLLVFTLQSFQLINVLTTHFLLKNPLCFMVIQTDSNEDNSLTMAYKRKLFGIYQHVKYRDWLQQRRVKYASIIYLQMGSPPREWCHVK